MRMRNKDSNSTFCVFTVLNIVFMCMCVCGRVDQRFLWTNLHVDELTVNRLSLPLG